MLKKIKPLQKAVTYLRWHTKKVSYGSENADLTFYVIRRHDMHAGLFSFVTSNLGAIQEAVDRGYTPVIDMMNAQSSMLLENEVGKRNAWEDYFEQPCGYSMQDVYRSKNVILGTIAPPAFYPDFAMIENPDQMIQWQKCARKYLRPLAVHQQTITEYYNCNFSGRRVLGVLCRGTDYLTMRPHAHPVQPEIRDVMDKCTQVMEEMHCDCIYMATEDQNIWDQFRNRFGNLLFSYQHTRLISDAAEYIDKVANEQTTPYERSREYLISIGILSKCNCLVAGAANGSYGALLLTKGYEYQYIFQLGRYE